MTKKLSILFAMTFAISFAQAGTVGLSEISTSLPVPNEAYSFDVNINLKKFSRTQEEKILDAAELIEQVVRTEEFRNSILNHKYKGKKRFVDSGGLSNAQVYKKILEGAERLKKEKDNQMDMYLIGYYQKSSTVGYTRPSTSNVWMNKKFLNKHRPWKVTTNIMHEWLHKVGFKHAKKRTASRKYSVPYAVGYLTARIAKKLD